MPRSVPPATLPRCPLSRLLLVLLLLAPSGVGAAVLQGTVTDSDSGRALPFAAVRVERLGDVRSGLAGPNGTFDFQDLPAGEWRVEFRYLGYSPRVETVRLAADEVRRLVVSMEVEAIRLETLEGEGDRAALDRDVQTGFVKLDSDDLARIPRGVEADPIRALQLLPGVQAASDISSGLYVRGGGPDQNLILLDGVPVYNPTHAFGLFSTFNPDAIGAVTLYKGAYPAEYGGRLGSVLQIDNRTPEGPEFSGQAGISTISARLTLEGPWRRGSWSVSGRRTYLDPLLAVLRRSAPEVPSYWFHAYNGRFTWLEDHHRVEATGYLSRDVLGLDVEPDISIDLGWGNAFGNLRYRWTPGETFSAGLQAWLSRYGSDTELDILATPVLFENSLLDGSIGGDLLWFLPPHHRLKVGAVWSYYDFRYTQSFNSVEDIDFRETPDDVALFLEDLWTPRAETSIRAGLRTRYVTDGDRVLWEPRVSARQELHPEWAVKAAGGIYHQYLQLITTEGFSAGDLYLPLDETARPSRSLQAVLGAEYEPSRRWRFTAETYFTDLQDLVTLRQDGAVDDSDTSTGNVFVTGGEGWASGLELFAERRMGSVTGWAGYAIGWTRRQWDELNQGREFPPKYDRRHDLKGVLQWDRGKWRYGASFVLGSGQAFTPASARYTITEPATGEAVPVILPAERNSSRLLPYHRLDLSVSRSFRKFGVDGEWSFQLFNAYSRRNDWFVSYDSEDPEEAVEVEVVKQLPLIPSLGLTFGF